MSLFTLLIKFAFFVAIMIFFLMTEELIEKNLKGTPRWVALIINLIVWIGSILATSKWLSSFIDNVIK